MKTRAIITVLCVISFVLSACASTVPQAPVTSTTIPTATASPMPTVTPTSTVTPTPTPEPTKDFSDLNECRQWPDAIQKCRVTLADLTSGRLVDYAKTVLPPLPESAFPATPRVGCCYKIYYTDPVYVEYYIHPVEFTSETNTAVADSENPIDNRLWFLVQSENNEVLPYDIMAMVVKIRTKSGKDGYYSIVIPPSLGWDGKVFEVETGMYKYWSNYSKTRTYPEPVYNPSEFYGVNNTMANWHFSPNSTLLKEIIEDTDGRRKGLMDEWISTGEVPVEFEKMPLYAYVLFKW